MTNEKIYFHYEKTRKQQAITAAISMPMWLCAPGLFLWLSMLKPQDRAALEDMFTYSVYMVCLVELGLLVLITWLLTHPATFYIKLTATEFASHHPMFKQWTFSVNPQDIIAIEHSTDSGADSTYITVKMHNGSEFLLSPNFAYSRKKLYQALASVNSKIKIPKNTWLFTSKGGR